MKAIIDLEELRAFINSFGFICGALYENKEHIGHEFSNLSEIWKDGNYDKFETVFNETLSEIEKFLHVSEMYMDYLQKKAQKVEQYLQGGY